MKINIGHNPRGSYRFELDRRVKFIKDFPITTITFIVVPVAPICVTVLHTKPKPRRLSFYL